MKYSELISFNPIETVIQINEADDSKRAGELVESYVMSDYMAENIKINIIKQLQFDEVVDNKGVLIIGNYGTGKSHLMSVISAIAQDSEKIEKLRNKKSEIDFLQIGGKFEVLRIEIGAVKMSLRNIVLTKVQEDLLKRGLFFNFPSESNVTNNKDILKDIMGTFSEKYPDKGYLIVVDELLDYLLSRKEQEIKLDLGFMRELGEFVKISKFRIVFGLQEKLFDNPKFSFVSSSLNRVKDRFEQAIIRKEDTAFVVSERILKKDPVQSLKVREHLQKFCNMYTNMSERLDSYIDLFPIHPSFIEIFNNIHIAENRHILKNISGIIREVLDEEIDPEKPCIVSYDSYWRFIKTNPAYRTDPSIKEVCDKNEILEGIIEHSFTKKAYKPLAKQIIQALSVHRLSTVDIHAKIGLTSESLKDDLCLYQTGMPENSSEFLLGIVQTTLREIILTVNGQFIENNSSNGQYFLDVKKDIDFDSKISQKASVIDEETLNRYFFDIVFQALEWEQNEYVTNYRIYEHSLIWEAKQIFRTGYLFLGTPENRPTAHPPEDYYIYFIPPYGETTHKLDNNDDEIFYLFKPNEEFNNDLKLYASSLLLKDLAEDSYKATYNSKAINYRRKLTKTLVENRFTIFESYYKKQKYKLIEILGTSYQPDMSFKDAIDKASSSKFNDYFKSKYPKYPVFKTRITEKNLTEIIRSGVDHFAGRTNNLSKDILDSLGLIDGDQVTINQSPIGIFYRNKLRTIPAQNVVNFTDIFDKHYNEFLDNEFQLNRELMIIVFIALVYTGDANIKLRNDIELTASNLDIIPRTSLLDLYDFKYISKPRDLQLKELIELSKILGISQGLIANPNDRQKGVEELIRKADELTSLAIQAKHKLNDDFSLWGIPLVNEIKQKEIKESVKSVIEVFSNFKVKFNTVAKLQNFSMSLDDISKLADDIRNLNTLVSISLFKDNTISNINYLLNIELMRLPDDIKKMIEKCKSQLVDMMNTFFDDFNSVENAEKINRDIIKIKEFYISFYMAEHVKMRLDLSNSNVKGEILSSIHLKNLSKLKQIPILPSSGFNKIEKELASLSTCHELSPSMLKTSHICPRCKYSTNEEGLSANIRLNELKKSIILLFNEWNNLLLDTISDPLILSQLEFLNSKEKESINEYLSLKHLPEVVDNHFVSSILSLLDGFEPIVINANDLIEILENLGPIDLSTFNRKISEIIYKYIVGKDTQKIRIIIRKKDD